MKPTVYIETTVISYLAARPSRDLIRAAHQQITHEWWSRRDQYQVYVSEIVTAEAAEETPRPPPNDSRSCNPSPFSMPPLKRMPSHKPS